MPRVLMIPGSYSENRFFSLLIDELHQLGVETVSLKDADARRFRFDILHLNFPTHYVTQYGPARALIWSLLFGAFFVAARASGKRVVYTVHDVQPLTVRNRWLLRPFVGFIHAITDAFVFLSESSRDSFAAHFPRAATKPWVVALHGPYPAVLLDPREREAVRARVAPMSPTLLVGFLGAIKPYKNFEAVAALPSALPDGTPVHLLIAGRVERGYEERVAAVLRDISSSRLTRIDGRLDEVELDNLIQAADLVFLPYVRGSNSGVALLVLSNGKRMVTSDLPVFKELETALGAPWVYTFADGLPGALAATVARAAADPVTPADEARLREYLDRVSFAAAARIVLALYATLLNPEASARSPGANRHSA